MPMEFAQLETLMKDNPDAVALLKDVGGKLAKFAEVEPKIATLADLETKAATLATLEKDVINLKAVNKDLEGQRAKWKEGQTGSAAEYNALKEQIEANKTAMTEITNKLKTAEDAASAATVQKRETDLKSSIIAAGAKLKGRLPEDDFLLLKAKGLVGHDKDGNVFFHKLNDKNEPVKLSTAEELIAWHYDRDKSRVNAGGNGGTGTDHSGAGGSGGAEAPKNRREARAAFLASRAK